METRSERAWSPHVELFAISFVALFILNAAVMASVLLLFVVPKHWVLSLPLIGRLAWAMLIVPLPMFFAGLIFSTTRGAPGTPRRCSAPS